RCKPAVPAMHIAHADLVVSTHVLVPVLLVVVPVTRFGDRRRRDHRSQQRCTEDRFHIGASGRAWSLRKRHTSINSRPTSVKQRLFGALREPLSSSRSGTWLQR